MTMMGESFWVAHPDVEIMVCPERLSAMRRAAAEEAYAGHVLIKEVTHPEDIDPFVAIHVDNPRLGPNFVHEVDLIQHAQAA